MPIDLHEKTNAQLIAMILAKGEDKTEAELKRLNKEQLIEILTIPKDPVVEEPQPKPVVEKPLVNKDDNGTPDYIPPDIVNKLGHRVYDELVEVREKVGETDLGKEIYTRKNKMVKRHVIQPVLTIEEAKQLGKQTWSPFKTKNGLMFTCIVEGRRFMLSEENYKKLGK